MKPRHLLAITPLAALWVRQLRFERRLSRRQGWWEREADRGMKRYGKEVERELGTFGEQNLRWSEHLVKQIEKAFSGAPGGARR